MKIGSHFLNRQDPYSRRQQGIRATQYSVDVDGALCLHCRYLAMGMDTGICSTRPDYVYRMIEQFREGFFELPLNGRKLGLYLPSVELGTVVGECQLEVPHCVRL